MKPKTKIPFFITVLLKFFFSLVAMDCSAQCGAPTSANCQGVPFSELIQSSSGNVDFVFDDFSKYAAGITQSGTTMLRLKVAANNASCKWALRVYIENNPGAGTPVNEWETLNNYGSGADAPTLDLLALKIYNGCGTPINSGIYQNFAAVNGSFIDIINDATLIPQGSCITNVNGAGSYLSSANEYTFIIDYRVVPGLTFTPGTYQLILHFCLVEQP
ncbi:hypothetical protein BH11BAC2_BH11BAC2_13310 [soil metagenome]